MDMNMNNTWRGTYEYLGHGDEHCVLFILLANIGQPAEDHHPHHHDQHQQSQLFVAVQMVLLVKCS
jgi:hypothetical protein